MYVCSGGGQQHIVCSEPYSDGGSRIWSMASYDQCTFLLSAREISIIEYPPEQETAHYYNFSNIRYAQPPVGDLRWAPPQPPLINRTGVNDGQTGVVCPQGYAQWEVERALFVDAYVFGKGSVSAFTNEPPPGLNESRPFPPLDPRTNEDCLFLDVLAPIGVYNNASSKATKGVPVVVWIFGGGFYSGSKESQGNPAGIVAQSQLDPTTAPGVVYVAINYRLGAFGWLAGPTFQAGNGTANAGLYDQRLALEWIQEHIHRFGGDPNQVTVMGASAGASSIMHQITAYAGEKGDAPFQQAFPQSAAFDPRISNYVQEEVFSAFLKNANATSLAGLRAASASTLIAANQATIYNNSYADTAFGPVVDGTFAPNLPGALLAQGRYAKNVKRIFTGHNTDEGLIGADPAVQNTSAFNAYLAAYLPDASPEILNSIETDYYPPIFDNKSYYGYNDTTSRLATLLGDRSIVCNVYYLLEAFGFNNTHAYLFDIGPSLHAEETPYMFYADGPTKDAYGYGLVNGTVAHVLQDWVINFAVTGNPNGASVPYVPVYGQNRSMGLLSDKGLGLVVPDPAGAERCEFWQKALYY
jgi:carboxylesterase type B